MLPWILALLSALLTCTLAIVYLWWIKRRRSEMQLGLQALAGMHWREFSTLIKRMLREQRGLREVADPAEEVREPSSDFLLSDGPNTWLVSCKHGLAYRIGTAAVNELGAVARLGGAKGGLLITEGRVERMAWPLRKSSRWKCWTARACGRCCRPTCRARLKRAYAPRRGMKPCAASPLPRWAR